MLYRHYNIGSPEKTRFNAKTQKAQSIINYFQAFSKYIISLRPCVLATLRYFFQ